MDELTGIAALWLAGTGLVAIVAYLWGHHDGHTDAWTDLADRAAEQRINIRRIMEREI